jgi:DNA-binding response OmpR family regulator
VVAVPDPQGTATTEENEPTGAAVGVVAIAHSRRGRSEGLPGLLSSEGYEVVGTPVRRTLVDELTTIRPDVVVVDASLDDFDVLRVCRDLRGSLSARIVVFPPETADETWTMAALRAGADDVLERGTSEAMIRTRMMAIVRSGPLLDRPPDHLVVGDVVVDVDGHLVTIAGDVVRFPMRLYSTLVELARRPNTVVTSEELLHDIWGVDPRPAHRRRLRVAVSSLRRLLGQGAQRPRIETVVRVGYRLATAAPTVLVS